VRFLVVVAIISILAAILFPVFATAREQARKTVCSSNMRQIGLGVEQYLTDYDERYPVQAQKAVCDFGVTTDTTCTQGYSATLGWQTNWISSLDPYIKSQGIFTCPDAQPYPSGTVAPTDQSSTNLLGNGLIFSSKGTTEARLPETDTLVLVSEYDWAFSFAEIAPSVGPGTGQTYQCDDATQYGGWHYNNYVNVPDALPTTDLEEQNNLHNHGANLLWADGHMKWQPIASLTASEFGLANGTDGQATDGVDSSNTACYTSAF
jgi:prepilin-type processing-associated H-X9-DG protein